MVALLDKWGIPVVSLAAVHFLSFSPTPLQPLVPRWRGTFKNAFALELSKDLVWINKTSAVKSMRCSLS
jgi:hypothetical protein